MQLRRRRAWALGIASVVVGAATVAWLYVTLEAGEPATHAVGRTNPHSDGSARVAVSKDTAQPERTLPELAPHQPPFAVAAQHNPALTYAPPSAHPGLAERRRDDPDPAPGHAHGVIPHPIDAPRMRLQAQHRLFADIKSALAAEDFARARSLLAEHDREFDSAEAWQDLREGYQTIADCKQHPSPETRTRGERFVAAQQGSTLRRAVRRACGVTQPPPAGSGQISLSPKNQPDLD